MSHSDNRSGGNWLLLLFMFVGLSLPMTGWQLQDALYPTTPGEQQTVDQADLKNFFTELGSTFNYSPSSGLLNKEMQSAAVKKQVIPGGQAVGVLLNAQGVLVTGLTTVNTGNGETVSPAEDAGIKAGDVIMQINGVTVANQEDVGAMIDNGGRTGESLNVTVKREGHQLNLQLQAAYCPESDSYRAGIYVRGSITGIGTLTYVDPTTRTYGALGHVVSLQDGGQAADLSAGEVVPAKISGLRKSERGNPGEKMGAMAEERRFSGNIIVNAVCGIFGRLQEITTENAAGDLYQSGWGSSRYVQPLPVAAADEIEYGAAQILTVLDGEQVESYDVEIRQIMTKEGDKENGKGLIIEVTDRELLERCGGIIQGMSGSPILQDGKIIGAVTHVFVNKPELGYGVLLEWMLQAAEEGMAKQTEQSMKQLGAKCPAVLFVLLLSCGQAKILSNQQI